MKCSLLSVSSRTIIVTGGVLLCHMFTTASNVLPVANAVYKRSLGGIHCSTCAEVENNELLDLICSDGSA